MARLERPRGSFRKHRREEHEVLEADDRRAPLSEQTRDVRAGEAAAEHERSALSVSQLYHRRVQVSVIGSGVEHEGRAEEVGRLLAERGCIVVTGGRGEVMAAAARGAKAAGGTTIGILPGESRAEANEWIDHAVATGLGHMRNFAVAASGDAVIAIGGKWGTLSEIAFAKLLGRPVVILEPGWELEGVERAATPEDAVDLVLNAL
jgi:uncharacterized protein (TIGR00725 family)